MQPRHIGIELELAVYDEGRPVTLPFIENTKANPLNINGNLLHKDASMLEMAMRPATSAAELLSIFKEALAESQKLIGNRVFQYRPAVRYDKEELDADPYANELGCSPSICIYPGMGVNLGDEGYKDNYRYGGMHLNFEHPHEDEAVIARLDATIGLYSVVMWEQAHRLDVRRRRQTYGRAGEYRIKDFGFEYRTLPVCAWTEDRVEMIWKMVEYCCDNDFTDKLLPFVRDNGECTYARTINTCNVNQARYYFTEIHGVTCENFKL